MEKAGFQKSSRIPPFSFGGAQDEHFGLQDQVGVDAFYGGIYERAEKEGLPTEEQRLEFLNSEGTWTSKEEAAIVTKEGYISGLQRSLGKLVIKRQQDQIKKTLHEERGNLQTMREAREELLHGTCEKYASNKLNNFVIN